MELTRRGFLKATTIGSTIALGFDLGSAKAEMRELKISRTTETRSTCPYCAVSCGGAPLETIKRYIPSQRLSR